MTEALRLALKAAWAALQAFVGRWLSRLADANAGAARQRQSQEVEDAKGVADAKARLKEWADLTPDERTARLRAGDDG